jgi:peptide methionine sulfoxide reductase msrA/msrB
MLAPEVRFMKGSRVYGVHGRAASPLAARVAIFILGWVLLCCKEPPAAVMSSARAVEPAAALAPAAEQAAPPGLHVEIAVLAGGCFWGMEEILRKIPGVISVEAGYTGGSTESPRYEDVHTGDTGHAEAVRVVFEPSKVTYADLLEKWFFRMHDPTTKNRQGNDIGTQYRSAIFVTTPEQRTTAEQVKARVAASGEWRNPITTEVVDAGPFTLAEDEHQDYLQKNPGGYTCHYMR